MFDERKGYRHDNALALESETISVLIVVSEANASRALVAGFALQESLGVIVIGEAGGVAVARDIVSMSGQEGFGDGARFRAADAEIDGSFGEREIEVAD